jgi:GntR family transcriptional regulator
MGARPSTAYSFISDTLRREIIRGTLKPGAQLPTERELCERFSASRITVRRALQILSDEMLVVRRQGSGTYVSGRPSRKIPLLNTDFSGSLSQHAPDLTRRLDYWDWRNANEEVAALLHSFFGARVLFARRIDLLDNTPVAYDEIHLPEQHADRLSESDLGQLDFLHHWQVIQQFRIGHLTQGIEAVAASSEQAAHIRIAEGSPVLKELDVVFLHTGAPCALFVSFYRHDLFRLTSTVKLPNVGESPAISSATESSVSALAAANP